MQRKEKAFTKTRSRHDPNYVLILIKEVDGHFCAISLFINKVVGVFKVCIRSLLTLLSTFFILFIYISLLGLSVLIDSSDLFNIGNYRNHRWFYSSCSRLWRMSDCQLAKLFFRTWSDVTMPLHPYSLLSLSFSLSIGATSTSINQS